MIMSNVSLSELPKSELMEGNAPAQTNNMRDELFVAIHAQNQAFMQLKLFYDAEYF